ncbi:class I SAM-dependent methyltransferase [Microlunatus parietis]|uniref:Trans-aconitate methyltransferase n=1 Tax=Microlunatus parietis TaxID=682979 RepID=A0A7Y9I3P4_9ACTN|nr:class I SAM-dependent methyltransferase [Microlunatus parietis]NYE69426.1 trans-aconitate methyltransferase [Microlunatus parietis]
MSELGILAARFELLQPRFGPGLERCLPLVADLTRASSGPVVELGCGTGSLLAALRARVGDRPRLTGVEADPVLLLLAREVHAVNVIEADFRDTAWLAASRPRVVVAVRALHYPGRDEVADLYRRLAERLPGGATLINADRFGPTVPDRQALAGWQQWWSDARREPRLADAFARRGAEALGAGNAMTIEDHRESLLAAGFGRVAAHHVDPVRGDAVLAATLV